MSELAYFDTMEGGLNKILIEANKMMKGFAPHLCMNTKERNFKANFGASLQVAYLLWCWLDVNNEGPQGGQVHHMLWTLMFLKVYATYDVLASRVGVHRDTYRKWVWLFLDKIAWLDIVSFS
jgi:hypothetical protein